mgnify:CR=1 FL=1
MSRQILSRLDGSTLTLVVKRIKGKLYVYDEFRVPGLSRPKTIYIGPLEEMTRIYQIYKSLGKIEKLSKRDIRRLAKLLLEEYMKKISHVVNSKKQTKKNKSADAGPRGFEPRTTGLGVRFSCSGKMGVSYQKLTTTNTEGVPGVVDNLFPGDHVFSDDIVSGFYTWLLNKVEEDTARYYLNIINRYRCWIPSTQLKRKEKQAYRHFINFIYEKGLISHGKKSELLDHYKLGRSPKKKKGHKWIEDSVIIKMYNNTVGIYRLIYKIGYFSGARLAHIVEMLNTWSPHEKVQHPNDLFEPRLYCNEIFCRYFIYIRRGRKPCDYIYFPRQLLKDIEKSMVKLKYKEVKNWFSDHKVMFSLLRKYFEQRAKQTCKKHNIPHDAVKFILTRELSVSGAHYDDTRRWADQLYSILVKKLIEVIGFG